MEAKGQLERLLRVQDLAIEIREAREIVERSPHRVQEIEDRFRERNAEFVAVKDQYDELEQDQRSRSSELTGLEEQRDKYMASLMEVKNQREYAAMLKEIDGVKAEIAGNEEAIIKDMEGIERLKGELATHEEHIAKEREAVQEERSAVEAAAKTARAKIEQLTAERARIESELPRTLVTIVKGLEQRRQGIFLSKAENGTCLSCFVRVRPQMFQEIKLMTALHSCGNCRRYLYYEPALRKQESGGVASGEDGTVEAVNGGAV